MNKIDNFFIVFYFKMIYFWIVRSTPISILSNNATTSSKFVFNKISMILIICNKLPFNSNIKSIILCHVDGWHIIRQQERR